MTKIMTVVSGIGILIALYLILSNSSSAVKIVNSIGGNSIKGIQVLQGRDKIMTNSTMA